MKFSTQLKPIAKAACLLVGSLGVSSVLAAPITWNGWSFDYEIGVNNEGLALKNVKYQTHTLLKKVSLPIIFNESSDGDPSGGGPTCTIPPDKLDAALSPMPWANNVTVSQRQFSYESRQWYEIGIYKKMGTKEYFQAYYLSADGIFDAHLYSRGNNNGCVDPFISRIPFWRIDTDVDGPDNDLIEYYDGLTSRQLLSLGTEGTGDVPRSHIRDLVTNNTVNLFTSFNHFNHPDGTATIDHPPLRGFYDVNIIQELLYKPNEDVGWAFANDLFSATPYDNNENINGKDILTWHRGGMGLEFQTGTGATIWSSNGVSLVPSWVPNRLPDVVVEDVTDSLLEPLRYDNGNFMARVKNRGIMPTPMDKAVAVGFSVDGSYRTWASYYRLLLPGEVAYIDTSATNTDFNLQERLRYLVPDGNHTITAWVDDVNRFTESDETNNKLSKAITISPPDRTQPYVVMTSPGYGSTVSGSSVVISVNAYDNAALKEVTLILRSNATGQETTLFRKKIAPFVFSWDTTSVPEGVYTLIARATDVAGNFPREYIAPVTVVTPATIKRPDLIVSNVAYANGQFSCTVKNVGTADIPAQALMVLAFSVDGVYKNWTSSYGPLAAGASVNLVSKGGNTIVAAGSHAIKAHIDDQNLIMEGNEGNNTFSKTITVP